MSTERKFWIFWLGGLAIFALARIPHAPLAIPEVPGGILDHQAAGSAQAVDRIQSAWRAAGLRDTAIFAMCHDLVFIGIYGLGSFWGGRMFAQQMDRALLVRIGQVVAIAAIVFLITDYVETGLQLVQLLRDSGSDWMAGTAAIMQPVKIVAFLVTFFGILAGLGIRRFSRPPA